MNHDDRLEYGPSKCTECQAPTYQNEELCDGCYGTRNIAAHERSFPEGAPTRGGPDRVSDWQAGVMTGTGIEGALLSIHRSWRDRRNSMGGIGTIEYVEGFNQRPYPSSDAAWAAWAAHPFNWRNKPSPTTAHPKADLLCKLFGADL